jgi:hypothetical protein
MATERQIAANRANAMKSTGPRTAAGRRKSSRNAFRHGLSLPISADPETRDKIAVLTEAIAGEHANEDQLQAARVIAEALIDLKRIRETKAATTPIVIDETLDPRALAALCALGRYERLALSRRKYAVRQLDCVRATSNTQIR